MMLEIYSKNNTNRIVSMDVQDRFNSHYKITMKMLDSKLCRPTVFSGEEKRAVESREE